MQERSLLAAVVLRFVQSERLPFSAETLALHGKRYFLG
jgi:hypothetical protein